MSTKKYCVYSHTNKTNGKIYIGQTCLKPEERWRNGKGYRRCAYFNSAIEKYGWDNFEHKIIKDNLSKDEADYWEIYYIDFYNSMDRQYGYNMSVGGSNGGHPQTEETRRKISENHGGFDGRKHSEASLKKMREAKTGENHPNYGKCLSDETKRKISAAHRKLRNKIVFCEELNRVFNSLDEAEKEMGISKKLISACCIGTNASCKGYHFKYINR